MRRRLLLVVLALCWSACWSTGPAARPAMPLPLAPADPAAGGPPSSGIRFVSRPQNRCLHAVTHLFEQAKSDIARSGMPESFLQELQEAAVESCEETEWSPESLDCYEGTGSTSEITACVSLMTSEQQEDFKKRMTELVQRQSSLPTSPTSPPSP